MKVAHIEALAASAFLFVIRRTGLSGEDLASRSQAAHRVAGRALFVWIMRTFGPDYLSNREIGLWLGHRDGSTVRHMHLRKVPRLQASDAAFRQLCDEARQQIEHEYGEKEVTWH